MPVEIRTRHSRESRRDHRDSSRVVLGAIAPAVISAMRLPPTLSPETALRVEFAMPAGLVLRPGEHVDILVP